MKVIYFLLLSLIFNIDGLSGFVVALAIIIIWVAITVVTVILFIV